MINLTDVTKLWGKVPLGLVLCSMLILSSCSMTAKQAAEAGPVDMFMGDWQGTWKTGDGTMGSLAAQVMALGEGTYRANLLTEFDVRSKPLTVLDGQEAEGVVRFEEKGGQGDFAGTTWQGFIKGDSLAGFFFGKKQGTFVMTRVERLSSTLEEAPPKGAVVLFDGTNLDMWQELNGQPARWELVDGAMRVSKGSIITKKTFEDFRLHLEFRTPFMPQARGQGRGNSGVYVQGRYEVQVLDSYGLEGKDNECGGIYRVAQPRVNMCAPPMQWQTYDMMFRAARFNESGEKTKNARLTVYHNGIMIHDDLEVPGPTGGAANSDESQAGGIYLQDHGNLVEYRNIWAAVLED